MVWAVMGVVLVCVCVCSLREVRGRVTKPSVISLDRSL
jgi:hypothetical protein